MESLQALRKTVERLRAPDGCPWDQEQTHRSLAGCLVEECAELLDTIEREDFSHMREELGDVLLQVVYHAVLAEESGRFTLEEVAADVDAKLIRRHPHVFGEESLDSSHAVLARWEEIKQAERNGQKTQDIPPTLSGLLYAKGAIKLLQRKGRALPSCEGPVPRSAEEAGRHLLGYVAACHEAGIDPEVAVRDEARRALAEQPTESGVTP